MPYHKDCRHWAGGPRCMNWACHCMASQFDPKLQHFLSYYGDSNMCECKNKEQAESWLRVLDVLMQGNPKFFYGNFTGQENALGEIRRLQGLAARTTLTDATLVTVRRERDEQSHTKNAALSALDKERQRHTETLKLLEKERTTSDQLTRELVKSRDELARAQSPLPPAMAIGSETQRHQQNVRQTVQKYARNDSVTFANHPRRVAEAVYYLLERDAQQTATAKRLSERLDALEPNRKQAAECPTAPWEMRPSGDFNPG